MPGSSALYWSASFIVVTSPRAAVIVSGGGVCAGEAQIESRSMLVMSDKRLVMEPSGEGREMILDIPGLPPYKGQPCCNAPGAQGGRWYGPSWSILLRAQFKLPSQII